MKQVLDDLGQKVYQEALDTTKVEPIAPGEMVDVSFDPLRMTFNIALPPEVDIGPYRDTRVEFTPTATVSDEAVTDALEVIQQQHALLEPVERSAQEGDVLRVDVLGLLGEEGENSEELLHDKDAEITIGARTDWPMPGFSEQLVGISSDETSVFDLSFPDDYVNTSLAGQTVHFQVRCIGIKSRTLPKLDDDFAKLVDGEPETMLELRIAIREQLQIAAESQQNREFQQKAVDEVVEGSRVSFPRVMLDNQIDELLREHDLALRRRGLTIQDHLKIDGKSEEQMRDELVPEATKRVKRALVLGKVVDREGLQVEDLAVEQRITASAEAFGDAADQVRSALDNEQGRRSIKNDLLVNLAIERLAEIAKGEAPELHDGTPETTAESDEGK